MERESKLSIERLKKIKGLGHFTEREFQEAKDAIEKFCAFLIKRMKDEISKTKQK